MNNNKKIMNMSTKLIEFLSGHENGIVIEKSGYEHSIFNSQYQQAIYTFDRLWGHQHQSQDQLPDHSVSPFAHGIDNQFSNIIAFCGDRGEGKSSCMTSFATMLTDKSARDAASEVLSLPKNLLRTDEIEWVDIIDPSFFDKTHNLLELLLGRMYKNASLKNPYFSKENYLEGDASAYRKLMEQFCIVKKSIGMLTQNNILYDSIEEISDLAAGINLREELRSLFQSYLTFLKKECLLICIDDLDLNISEGYKMAEMLRKYLICPECIILVAVKVDQLIEIIATAHKKEVNCADITWGQCKLMAQKYVAKLLPGGNRIFMPSPTEICDAKIYIKPDNGDTRNVLEYTVKERIVQLIFQKTGYVFYNGQYLSPIIPQNLRNLRHLLSMLESLPDARNEEWEDDETGREVFRDYFFGTWAAQLSPDDFQFAQQLSTYGDLSTMNAFVVQYFVKRVQEEGIIIEKTDLKDAYLDLYANIASNKNSATNISFGDVMFVIKLVNGISLNENLQNLIFLIKTAYSMRLYACYNVISESDEALYPSLENDVSIHQADKQYDRVNQLQRLLNGSYFTYPQGSLLSSKKQIGNFRDHVTIDFGKIETLFSELLKAPSKETEEYLINLWLCEYMALCIIRTTTEEEKTEDKGLNRTNKVPTYLGVLSSSANYAIFDFLHPFYSLCNIEYAYRRFDGLIKKIRPNDDYTLYDIAINNPKSIMCQLFGINNQGELKHEYRHQLISDAVIRITDVQWAIYDELLRTRDLHKNGDEAYIMSYEDIINLHIKLYPRKLEYGDKESPHELRFKWLSVLIHCLKGEELTKQKQSILLDKLGLLLHDSTENKLAKELQDTYERILLWVTLNKFPKKGKEVASLISKAIGRDSATRRKVTTLLYSIFDPKTIYNRENVTKQVPRIINLLLEEGYFDSNGH